MTGDQYTFAAYVIALGLIFGYAIVLLVELRAAARNDRGPGEKP